MACLAFGIYVEFCCLVNFDNRNTPNNSGVQIIGGTSIKPPSPKYTQIQKTI